MKTRGWRRELAQGARMPFGYGVAWVDWSRRLAVCYPRPADWLARQWRELAWRVERAARALVGPGPEEQQIEDAQRIYRERQILAEEFATGYMAGWQECLDACAEAIEEQVERSGLRKFARTSSLPAKKRQRAEAEPHTDKHEHMKLN